MVLLIFVLEGPFRCGFFWFSCPLKKMGFFFNLCITAPKAVFHLNSPPVPQNITQRLTDTIKPLGALDKLTTKATLSKIILPSF